MPITTRAQPTISRAVAWPNSVVLNWMRDRIADAGGDPECVPTEPFAFWRISEVTRRTGLGKATLYRKIAEGTFPKGVLLGSAPSAAQAA